MEQQEGGSGSQHGVPPGQMIYAGESEQEVVEEASPISSRGPGVEHILSSGGVFMGDEDDGVGGSSSRWPRQETLALIQIRSQMDAAFRDATLKAPLWEHVSRKLAELGYKRSAKKCKEKFDNVHKYYKRTKEGRAGRQDGKTYRFFSQLEALHNVLSSTSSTTINVPSPTSQLPPTTGLDVAPVSVGIPIPMSSQPPPSTTPMIFPPGFPTSNINPPPTSLGLSFSSPDGSSSSSPTTEEDDDHDETHQGLPSSTPTGGTRKRKKESHHTGETRQMMDFFEELMKQVMQKQEAMQQRFLEAIEKREQDRMIREEAWKRQEMARLSREHEMMAQERALSASRDAAIVSFLQKITGQTIQLPSPITLPASPQPPAPQFSVPPFVTTQPHQQSAQQVVQPPPPPKPSQPDEHQLLIQTAASSDIIMAVPEQQVPPQPQQMEIVSMSGGMEVGSSSRWPKAEVVALINLRSGLETRYQEAGPKGPLWEEISAGMQRLGYNRNAKRCKEKWENINKYYKKVKESNKKRPEDSKTCPYFHQLDALHSRKVLGTTAEASTVGFSIQSRPEDQRQPENQPVDQVPAANVVQGSDQSQTKIDASNASMGTGGATKKPEDIVKELMEKQGQLMVDEIGDDESEEEEEEDDGDESESQEEKKMGYKIEFERQNGNGKRNGAPPSFLAMVQ